MLGKVTIGALVLALLAAHAHGQGPGGAPPAGGPGERMRGGQTEGHMDVDMHGMMIAPGMDHGMGGPGMGGPGGGGASFLLAATGELKLSDAQVVRLAAISRRAADRHRAMEASADSIHRQMQNLMPRSPNDTAVFAAHRRAMERMHTAMEREHDLQQADLRDAIAVLTPDQQAQAWQMVQHHAAMRGGPQMRMHGGMGGGGMMQPGMMRRRTDGGPMGMQPARRPPDGQ